MLLKSPVFHSVIFRITSGKWAEAKGKAWNSSLKQNLRGLCTAGCQRSLGFNHKSYPMLSIIKGENSLFWKEWDWRHNTNIFYEKESWEISKETHVAAQIPFWEARGTCTRSKGGSNWQRKSKNALSAGAGIMTRRLKDRMSWGWWRIKKKTQMGLCLDMSRRRQWSRKWYAFYVEDMGKW